MRHRLQIMQASMDDSIRIIHTNFNGFLGISRDFKGFQGISRGRGPTFRLQIMQAPMHGSMHGWVNASMHGGETRRMKDDRSSQIGHGSLGPVFMSVSAPGMAVSGTHASRCDSRCDIRCGSSTAVARRQLVHRQPAQHAQHGAPAPPCFCSRLIF